MRLKSLSGLALGLLGLGAAQNNPAVKEPSPTEIGLAVGQPAPSFTLRDQFGNLTSNATLRGSNGTVLLFFRSADW
jgi:cytochrome oxidase Cu insertion factor (SCO1/SenC/PrrC family)